MNRLEFDLVFVFIVVLILPVAAALSSISIMPTSLASTTTQSTSAGLQCYVGIAIKIGQLKPIQLSGKVASCSGECSNTTIYGTIIMYACDPIAFCKQFNLTNRCYMKAENISGCCCDMIDNCNFPGVSPTPDVTSSNTTPTITTTVTSTTASRVVTTPPNTAQSTMATAAVSKLFVLFLISFVFNKS